LKIGEFSSAKASCELALKGSSNNPKLYYRLALAHGGMENYREAVSAMNEAITLEPNNKFLRNEKERLKQSLKEYNRLSMSQFSGKLSVSKDEESRQTMTT
jgi:tetratricopeptide (TPR) repeat protein